MVIQYLILKLHAVSAKVELWGPECGGIFSIQPSLMDISHLLHKTGFVKTESVGTVVKSNLVISCRKWFCNILFILFRCSWSSNTGHLSVPSRIWRSSSLPASINGERIFGIKSHWNGTSNVKFQSSCPSWSSSFCQCPWWWTWTDCFAMRRW